MNHLLISREFPPAAYPPGGIGTYAWNIARLLAEAGETVHVIGQRWDGAPQRREHLCDGRLIVHRVAADDAIPSGGPVRWQREIEALIRSPVPAQWFSLQAALLAERLIQQEGIDVIEGQEWEAPLYFLLLRRAVGLGPRRQPPCIVHLHSPTELIVRFNGWDVAKPEFLTVKRMEDYCIGAADALLCPSDFLARHCERRYGLTSGSVHVIRLPLGRTPFLARDINTWKRGNICYVGRLEPRKGVIEWVDAAVRVAATQPEVTFDFVGADLPVRPYESGGSMRAYLEARIPSALRSRFRFHGSVNRQRLHALFKRARAAVVPSRWENFPNTCIEAMCTGLPVIATRFGGMAEMLDDGISGWLTEGDLTSMTPALTKALQRCLAVSPNERQTMGLAAADAVRRLCDNDRTVEQHLLFRARVAQQGRVVERPAPRVQAAAAISDVSHQKGIGIVAWVASHADGRALLDSIKRQHRPPAVLVVAAEEDEELRSHVRACHGIFVGITAKNPGAGWSAAFDVAAGTAKPTGWMFLDHDDRLEPDALERMERALVRAPDLGLISCWTGFVESYVPSRAPLHPALPYQWLSNDTARATVFRAEALPAVAPFGTNPVPGAELWGLTLSMMLGGWTALTYPAMLATRSHDDIGLQWSQAVALHQVRAALIQRFSSAMVEQAPALIDLYLPAPTELFPLSGLARTSRPMWFARWRRAIRLLRQPRRIPGAMQRRLHRLPIPFQFVSAGVKPKDV